MVSNYIFRVADPPATRVSLMVCHYHHRPKCLVKRLDCSVQGCNCSDGSELADCCQRCIFYATDTLPLQPNWVCGGSASRHRANRMSMCVWYTYKSSVQAFNGIFCCERLQSLLQMCSSQLRSSKRITVIHVVADVFIRAAQPSDRHKHDALRSSQKTRPPLELQ